MFYHPGPIFWNKDADGPSGPPCSSFTTMVRVSICRRLRALSWAHVFGPLALRLPTCVFMCSLQDISKQPIAHCQASTEQGTGASHSVWYHRGTARIWRCLSTAWCVTAAEVHAHPPPVPADLQPSLQRGSFSDRSETLRQHFCFPVSPGPSIQPSLANRIPAACIQTILFLFQWFPHWKLAFDFKERAGERLLHQATGGWGAIP